MMAYFLSILKKRIPIIIALTILFMIAAVTVNNTSSYITVALENDSIIQVPKKGLFLVFAIEIIAVSIIVALIEFSFKMNRIQAQQAYTFPIKREKLFLSRYLVGLFEIIIPFTVSFFVSALLVYNAETLYDSKYIFLYYPFAVFALILFYSYIAFIYCRANNLIDGISGILLSVLAPYLLGIATTEILSRSGIQLLKGFYFCPLYVIDMPTKFVEAKLIGQSFDFSFVEAGFYIFWVVVQVVVIGFMNFFNKRTKIEDLTNTSNSIFVYKVFLPVSIICLTIFLSFYIKIGAIFVGVAATIGGYMLAERGNAFGNRHYSATIVLIVSIVAGIVLSALEWGGVL